MGGFLCRLTHCAGGITRPGALCLVAMLPACDLAAPETGYAPSEAARAAAYPDLLTQPQVTAAAEGVAEEPDVAETQAELAARVAALRARAAALSATGMSAEERARLEAASAAAGTR